MNDSENKVKSLITLWIHSILTRQIVIYSDFKKKISEIARKIMYQSWIRETNC